MYCDESSDSRDFSTKRTNARQIASRANTLEAFPAIKDQNYGEDNGIGSSAASITTYKAL